MKKFIISVALVLGTIAATSCTTSYASAESSNNIHTAEGAIHALYTEWNLSNNHTEKSIYLYENLSKELGKNYQYKIRDGWKDYEIISTWCENPEFMMMVDDGLDVECDSALYEALGGEEGCKVYDIVTKIYHNHPCDDTEDPLNIVSTFFCYGKNGVSKDFYDFCVACANEPWSKN